MFPQAMATGNIHMGTIAGKLNGVMPATTPKGWRREKLSTAVATWSEYSPFIRCGMPQANSTTSMPRATSPLASASVLPCSAESCAASALRSRCSSSRKRNSTCARRAGGVADQPGKALAAAATADFTSSVVASGTRPVTSPVAGL